MFEKARLTLTMWYLLISMMIAGAFSFVIYRSINLELSRVANRQVFRMEREFGYPAPPLFEEEIVEESRKRVIRVLGVINLVILGLAGAGGYYLAGKTLAPIQEMLEKQQQFITNASHDLKTPITAMRSSLEVALRDPQLTDSQGRKHLSENLQEVLNLQRLTENLLELTHSYQTVKLVKTSLEAVVESAIAEVRPLSSAKNIKIVKARGAAGNISADPLTFQRAIVAVLDNAIKYSGSGAQITVKQGRVGKKARVLIQDHGPGIAASEIAKVKERFYRSDSARSGGGYGLGLTIAEEIMKAHHGELVIESRVGHGTKVSLTVPAVS